MSLDGFVAYHDDNPGPVFDWYAGGPVEITVSLVPVIDGGRDLVVR